MYIRPRSTETGVTLVELLVTLSLVAIILTLAVPGFQTLIANAKMTNVANSLIGHLQYARSEAVKRGAQVTACPSTDRVSCVSSNPSVWSNGFLVAVLGGDGTLTEILRWVDAEEMRGLWVESGGKPRFIFNSDGSAGTTNNTVRVCSPNEPRVRTRLVVVNPVGRTYVYVCQDPAVETLDKCEKSCP